jgi:hypothetical protein
VAPRRRRIAAAGADGVVHAVWAAVEFLAHPGSHAREPPLDVSRRQDGAPGGPTRVRPAGRTGGAGYGDGGVSRSFAALNAKPGSGPPEIT